MSNMQIKLDREWTERNIFATYPQKVCELIRVCNYVGTYVFDVMLADGTKYGVRACFRAPGRRGRIYVTVEEGFYTICKENSTQDDGKATN